MDQFENEVSEMLKGRTAAMPEPPEVTPALLARARRRRVTKLTALVATVVVVATGTTAAVAEVVGRRGPDRVATSPEPSTTQAAPPASKTTSTTAPSTTTTVTPPVATTTVPASVPTVACPISYALTNHGPPPVPPTAPRVPAAGDPSLFVGLSSFAPLDDQRYIVLGPKDWSCQTSFATDGDNGVVVYKTASPPATAPDLFTAPIAIENDWMWHGLSGTETACTVSTDPAVLAEAATDRVPCAVPAGRVLTRIDAHASTFLDADGARGASWILLPTTPNGADGKLSVLTCRPTDGLTADQCDTIINDWVARNDTVS